MHRHLFIMGIVILLSDIVMFRHNVCFSLTQTRNELVNRANFNPQTKLYHNMVFKWDIQRVLAKGLKGECGVSDPVFLVCYDPSYMVLLCKTWFFGRLVMCHLNTLKAISRGRGMP